MEIKVLGMGCGRCQTLEHNARLAAEALQVDATVEKVEDMQKIMEYGVLKTPGLIINGKVVLSGRVPGIEEMKEIIGRYAV